MKHEPTPKPEGNFSLANSADGRLNFKCMLSNILKESFQRKCQIENRLVNLVHTYSDEHLYKTTNCLT